MGTEEEAPARAWGPRLMAAGFALVAAAVFVAQNRERVETKFLFFTGTPRLWVIIVFSLVLGALLGQAIPALRRRRKGKDGDAKGKDKDKD